MRLSAADEFFTHQTALPHAMVATSDPSWRERYWFSLHDVREQDTVLTIGMGKYPNQDVMEAFAVLSRRGEQRNLRLSRTLLPDSFETRVGPLAVEVIEPLRQLRLRLDDNDSGVAFDLMWHAATEPLLEGRFFQVSRARATYDAIRYVQHGRVEGHLSAPGYEAAATVDSWWGERDHSWGTRPLPRAPGQPPGERPEWRMLLFAPLQLPDFGVHVYLQESSPGRTVHLSAGITPRVGDPQPEEAITAVRHDLEWVVGAPAPTLRGGSLTLVLQDGRTLDLQLRALPGRAHLRGGGYEGWNGWFQGQWRGDSTAEADVWELDDATQVYRYAKAGSDHLVEVTCDGQTGYGIVEYMVLPGYGRYDEAVPPRPSP
ncbi:MAG TPA: hypothetical protein VNU26_08935 [Mycobacteriales bacterium]|nr:hypothetical protein [Mycobacteriales bacterium]